jgi:hypothetical protein
MAMQRMAVCCAGYIRDARPTASRTTMSDEAPATHASEHHAYAVVRELGKGGQGRTVETVE